jgi:hypothetical protein
MSVARGWIVVAAGALVTSALAGSAASYSAAMMPAALRDTNEPPAALSAATDEFNARKDHFVDVMAAGRPIYFDHDAAVGLLMLEQAARTGDNGAVAEANRRVIRTLRKLKVSPANNQFSAQHGGAFTLLRLVLQFGDQPELLYPQTLEAIVRGNFPNGASEPQHSLLAYRDQFFTAGYNGQGVGLDVRQGVPWDPASYDEYRGTENHKLQSIVTGMLLSEIYAADVVGGVPVKDDTEALDDQWHYFRDAFYQYSAAWADGRADHFTRDVAELEDNSIQYMRAHLGDYWLLRDLFSDSLVRSHAEVMIDRILADWVEDLVGPIRTGTTERVTNVSLDDGLSFQEHIINYLLFDNLGEPLPADFANLHRFGGWANLAVATTDYVPGSPGFPMVLVDIARNKGEGYAVREGGTDHNWVESDFALGFRLDGRVFGEDLAGGFYVVAEEGGTTAGQMVTVYNGDSPFRKGKPAISPMGVQSGRTALFRSTGAGAPTRVWVQSTVANMVAEDRWLFVEQPGWSGRTVYLAIGTSKGTLTGAGSVDDGAVFQVGSGATLVWEVATSDEVASFEEFRERLGEVAFAADGAVVDFVSPFSGVALHLEDDPAQRTIDGESVDWAGYQFSFSTPWGSHGFGTTHAAASRDGQSVEWDWDPDGSGDYEGLPAKRVTNADGGPS